MAKLLLLSVAFLAGAKFPFVGAQIDVAGSSLRGVPALLQKSGAAYGYFPGRRLDATKKIMSTPLYGSLNEYAYYFIDVLVGSPPQRQSVILDSGSSLLGFSCSRCRSCGKHLDPPFDLGRSLTAVQYSCQSPTCMSRDRCPANSGNDTCQYTQVYSEGSSIEGFFFSDIISLEPSSALAKQPSIINPAVRYNYVGCHLKETALFTTQRANGILGVSFPKGGRQPTAMDALFAAPDVNSRVYSLCVTEDGGIFYVGGYNSSLHVSSLSKPALPVSSLSWMASLMGGGQRRTAASSTPQVPAPTVVWTNIISDTAYAVRLTSMEMDDKLIAAGTFAETLVDSGTTYSYFPPLVYQALAEALEKVCDRDPLCTKSRADLVCWNVPATVAANPEDYIAKLPSIFVDFGGGGRLEWRAVSYMFRKSERVWCAAIENNKGQQTILGMSFIKNVNLIFDRENDRLGFAPANCPAHFVDARPTGVPTRDTNPGASADVQLQAVVDAPKGSPKVSLKGSPKVSSEGAALVTAVPVPVPAAAAAAVPEERGFSKIPLYKNMNPNLSKSQARTSWAIAGGFATISIGALGYVVARSIQGRRAAAYDPMLDTGDESPDGSPGDAAEDPTGYLDEVTSAWNVNPPPSPSLNPSLGPLPYDSAMLQPVDASA